MNRPLLSFSILLSLGCIWGTGYSIARFVMTHNVNPLGYALWQTLGPATLLSLLTLYQKNKLNLSLKHCRYYAVCGLTGIVLPNTNAYFAAAHLPAGLLAVIVNTVPIITYILALILRVENFNNHRLFAVLLGLLGLSCILIPNTSLPAHALPWALQALLTPLSFAFCAVFIKRYYPPNSDPVSLAAGMLIFASLILIPFIIAKQQFYPLVSPLKPADWLIMLEIILASIGYILFFKLIKIAGPVYYSFVDTIVALTALFWGYVVFHEYLNAWTGSGVACILIALLIVNKRTTT